MLADYPVKDNGNHFSKFFPREQSERQMHLTY